MARIPGWKKHERNKYRTSWRNIRKPMSVSAERNKDGWHVKHSSLFRELQIDITGTRTEAEIGATKFMRHHPEGI